MGEIDIKCAETFFRNQDRLFPKPVVESVEESMEFLEDCFASVFDSEEELIKYMDEEGIDHSDYTDIREILEVFELADGRYLYVEA